MSEKIFSAALRGSHAVIAAAEALFAAALQKHGPGGASFPGTAFSLPVIYGMLGVQVKTLADMATVFQECRRLYRPLPEQNERLTRQRILDAGIAALYAEEMLEAIRCLDQPGGCPGSADSTPSHAWCGAADDAMTRQYGIGLIDKTVPGFAIVTGSRRQNGTSTGIAGKLRGKNLYVFLAGDVDGVGRSAAGMVSPIGFACRVALLFGGVKPGDGESLLGYCRERIPGFVLLLGPVNERWAACAVGALNWGLPIIGDAGFAARTPAANAFPAQVIGNIPLEAIVDVALELRGMKVPVAAAVDIPVSLGPAFAGERIRDDVLFAEYGGGRTMGVELLVCREMTAVRDGEILLAGPDISDISQGRGLPLALLVEVAGRTMQPGCEPVFERRLHALINSIEGVMHVGRRDLVTLRISMTAARKGLSFRHIGRVIHDGLHQEFDSIIDKVQVKIFTEQAAAAEVLTSAGTIHAERDRRLGCMTDESTDIFYSCTICQSFAPDHVCVITPERAGMCGAYGWLDGKVSSEMSPGGPNRPISKGACLDPLRGDFAGINAFVRQASHGKIAGLSCYSLVHDPMTAGNCFEAVAVLLPLCNGIMVVNREYPGMTPSGMTFSALADLAGGGEQTPGLVGICRHYPVSPKFFPAEGGLRRLVWMPRMLREELREELTARCTAMGLPGFFDMIADEGVGATEEEVQSFLLEKGHPALQMEAFF